MSRRASSGIAARIGVSMMPGDTALTRPARVPAQGFVPAILARRSRRPTIAEFRPAPNAQKPVTKVSDRRDESPRRVRRARHPRIFLHGGANIFHFTVLNGPVRSCAAVTTT